MKLMRVVSLVMAALCALGAVAGMVYAAYRAGPREERVWRPLREDTRGLSDEDCQQWTDANATVAMCPSAKNFYLRGTLVYQLDRRELAVEDFVKAITLDPAYRDKVNNFYHEDKHIRPVSWGWDGSCK